MKQRLSDLEDKLDAARHVTATVSSLSMLNTQLVGQDQIDPSTLPKLDTKFLELGMLNDDVLVQSLRASIGADASTYNTEARQLVTLMCTKLEQTRSFYEAVMLMHNAEEQRDLLLRRTERSNALVISMSDEVD